MKDMDEVFLYFVSGDHEWGYWVDSRLIPSIGDKVFLYYGLPDQESSDETYGVIIEKEWSFNDMNADSFDICFKVKLEEPIPDGNVADSTAWPSLEHSKRERDFQESLKEMNRKMAEDGRHPGQADAAGPG